MAEVSKQGCMLSIGSEIIQFDVPVAQYIESDEIIAIRLKNTGEEFQYSLRNVLGINMDGRIRWKISKKPDHRPRSYTNIYTKDQKDLWAYNFSGNLYQVNPKTGKILSEEFVK